MKQLTQAVFSDMPDDVISAAIDEDGEAWGFYEDSESMVTGIATPTGDNNPSKLGCWCPHAFEFEFIGSGYDATNWRNSAIDREVVK